MNILIHGYCAVTADILHIGHIRFINDCKSKCDFLTVGIMTDECVKKYKGEYPIMNQEQRKEIVLNLKSVDNAMFQDSFEFSFQIISTCTIFDSEEHKRPGAIFYIPRTEGISSSQIKEKIYENINNRKRPV